MEIFDEAIEQMENNKVLLMFILLLISWDISEKYLQSSFVNPSIFTSLIGMLFVFGMVGWSLLSIFSLIIIIKRLKEVK